MDIQQETIEKINTILKILKPEWEFSSIIENEPNKNFQNPSSYRLDKGAILEDINREFKFSEYFNDYLSRVQVQNFSIILQDYEKNNDALLVKIRLKNSSFFKVICVSLSGYNILFEQD